MQDSFPYSEYTAPVSRLIRFIFSSTFLLGVCPCTIIFSNGDIYDGQFKNGKKKGKGVYTCSNGKK